MLTGSLGRSKWLCNRTKSLQCSERGNRAITGPEPLATLLGLKG